MLLTKVMQTSFASIKSMPLKDVFAEDFDEVEL